LLKLNDFFDNEGAVQGYFPGYKLLSKWFNF